MSKNLINTYLFIISALSASTGVFEAACMQRPSSIIMTHPKEAFTTISPQFVTDKMNSPCFASVFENEQGGIEVAFSSNPREVEFTAYVGGQKPKFSSSGYDFDYSLDPLLISKCANSSMIASSSSIVGVMAPSSYIPGTNIFSPLVTKLLEDSKDSNIFKIRSELRQIFNSGKYGITPEEKALFFIDLLEMDIREDGSLKMLDAFSQHITFLFFQKDRESLKPKEDFLQLKAEQKIMLLWNLFVPKIYILSFLESNKQYYKLLKDSREKLEKELNELRSAGALLYKEILNANIDLKSESNLMGLLRLFKII